jgi:hypothetical protein
MVAEAVLFGMPAAAAIAARGAARRHAQRGEHLVLHLTAWRDRAARRRLTWRGGREPALQLP